MEFRTGFGELNSFVLDSLRGLDETIQYGQGEKRMEEMEKRSVSLGNLQKNLSRLEGSQRSFTTLAILAFSLACCFSAFIWENRENWIFQGSLPAPLP